MRAIERTTQFKRDFKREMKGRHRPTLEADLTGVLRALVGDAPLAEKYRDHPLSGEWSGFRDCHINALVHRAADRPKVSFIPLSYHG